MIVEDFYINNKINYLVRKYQEGNSLSIRSILDNDNNLNGHKFTDSEIAFLDDYYNRLKLQIITLKIIQILHKNKKGVELLDSFLYFTIHISHSGIYT